jgi:hypothetical protein
VGERNNDVGVVIPITNVTTAATGPVQAISGTSIFEGIGCLRGSTCFAVGADSSGDGILAPINSATDSVGALQSVPGSFLSNVGCTTSNQCLVAGFTPTEGEVLAITNDATGALGPAQLVTGTLEVDDVACPNKTTCVADGYSPSRQGEVMAITNLGTGAPGPLEQVNEGVAVGIACESSSRCLGSGATSDLSHGVLVPISGVGCPPLLQFFCNLLPRLGLSARR